MQQKHRSEIKVYLKQKRNRSIWQRVISFLICVTVFMTTYVLILPALTLEKDAICGLEEHIHETACFSDEAVLICSVSEHTHGDGCYNTDEIEETVGLQYLCGNAAHVHSDECNAEGICSVPQHAHDASCVIADYDLNADMETTADWEATMATVQLSGNWPRDIVNVASSQIGYTESAQNVLLNDDELNGYSRYGEWYGDPYGEWNAMFTSFALHYAGVDVMSAAAEASSLMEAAKASGIFTEADGYTARPGDIVFFAYAENATGEEVIPQRTGIVAEITPEKLTTVEGDVNGKVDYVTYELPEAAIAGYAKLPAGDLIIFEHQGEDYQIKAQMSPDAGIPDTAEFNVREILEGTEEYNTYYAESVKNLLSNSNLTDETELGITFSHFFDISFIADGTEIEPILPVDIRISYDDSFEISETKESLAVHFANDGVELINAMTSHSVTEGEVDTFSFTQNSFSVTGTLVANELTKAATSYTNVSTDSIDVSGGMNYVVYTELDGKYYALDGDGKPVEITFADDGVTIAADITNKLIWSFSAAENGAYLIQNQDSKKYMHSFNNGGNDKGITTTGAYSSVLEVVTVNEEKGFKVKSNSNYSRIVQDKDKVKSDVTDKSNEAATFFLAAKPQDVYHVWFDGTDGGLMGLYGSPNTYLAVQSYDNTITLPETWDSPAKYSYKLNGWYDIVNQKYYKPGDTVVVTSNLVFYADWIAETYNVGFENEDTVESLDTSDFITTYVFDYNILFNVHSLVHTGSISAAGHSESWTLVTNGTVPYDDGDGDKRSLGFVLLDYDSSGDISYPNGRDGVENYNRDVITPGIIDYVYDQSGEDLLDLLFDPDDYSVIGKTNLGTGNFLFQYMDKDSPNYDGHDGYYYFHSKLNAASYNQDEQRFYLYDYQERTTDSWKDGGPGEFSDFLPFNSPYANIPEGQKVNTYTSDTGEMGYMYDAKDEYRQNNIDYSKLTNAGTNYWFGIRTDIEFFLPNNPGEKDEYDNYGNISTKGEHMVFEFHGDDDLWVYVDGELVLDVGGVHGVEYGNIDFSTGQVTSGEGAEQVTRTFEEVLGHNIGEGTHTLTVYYMERGSSQSNCSIYFNIAPRYSLEITKEDIFTAEKLDGAEFTVYTDEECTHVAELWESEEAHRLDLEDGVADNTLQTLVVENGKTSCWGISAGKTYYIKETKSPDGYPVNDDLIRITLNNRGTATIETTTLNGADGESTEGYAVIKQNVNDTLKIVALTVSNQVDSDTTQLRVVKAWDESSVNIPNSIQVYLTVNGVRVGRMATLSEANGWSYKWTGLPKYEEDGQTLIQYSVEEVQVPGYETEHVQTQNVTERVDWIKTEAMADSSTYILVNAGRALSYNGEKFSWVTMESAQSDEGKDAQWSVVTNQYGFRLTNGSGYNLTYQQKDKKFYGTTETASELNQVIYYLENRLVAHDHDLYFQFNADGKGVEKDGLIFTLYRKDVLTGTLVDIKNTPIEESKQTHVEVNKIWDDLADHSKDEVIVRLYADGRDTGRFVALNSQNDWKNSFDGLPYYAEDGVTPIVYTVKEDSFDGYTPDYSDPVPAEARSFASWVGASALEVGGIYRFVSGANALAADENGNIISAVNDVSDLSQQWQVEEAGKDIRLKNVAYETYLASNDQSIFTTTNAASAAKVTFTNGILKMGKRVLILNTGSLSSSAQENNGTVLSLAKRGSLSAMPGTAYTVTNREAAFVMPNTGVNGEAISVYNLGTSLLAATSSFYVCEKIRKRKKQKIKTLKR